MDGSNISGVVQQLGFRSRQDRSSRGKKNGGKEELEQAMNDTRTQSRGGQHDGFPRKHVVS